MLMRNLFLVLVLVNLAFAAWSAWFAAPTNVGRPSDDGLPALTLVSELPADLRSSGVVAEPADAATEDVPVPPADVAAPAVVADAGLDAGAAADEPAADAGVQAAARCTSVGPFRELSQAATAAAALRNAG